MRIVIFNFYFYFNFKRNEVLLCLTNLMRNTMLKMSLRILSTLVVVVLLTACSNKDQFAIAKNKVGYITSETTAGEIEELFKRDSVVKHLLTITPKEPLDSLSKIGFVDIFDPAYVTEKGIGLNSTFEEINLLTRIGKVEATFTKATLYLDELNATMTLDKQDLGIKTMTTSEIQLEQIPNLVKPKTFVVWFD